MAYELLNLYVILNVVLNRFLINLKLGLVKISSLSLNSYLMFSKSDI